MSQLSTMDRVGLRVHAHFPMLDTPKKFDNPMSQLPTPKHQLPQHCSVVPSYHDSDARHAKEVCKLPLRD